MTDGPYNLDDYADDDGPPAATNRKRKSGLPKGLPDQGAQPAQFAAFITTFAHLEDDPVVSADRWGVDGSEPIELVLRSGQRIGWSEQDHLFGPRLQRPLIMLTGHKPRVLTQHDTNLVAWSIIQLATLRSQATEADEFRELWVAYAAERTVVTVDRTQERAMRGTLLRWRYLADANEERPFVLLDQHSGERLVRRLDFAQHVRTVRRAPVPWARLQGLARMVGWELDRLQYRATAGGAPYVDAKVFVVAPGWGENDV